MDQLSGNHDAGGTVSSDAELDRQVTAQSIDFLYKNLPYILLNVPLVPAALLVMMWGHIDPVLLVSWTRAQYTPAAKNRIINTQGRYDDKGRFTVVTPRRLTHLAGDWRPG